jgi:excisionase family DNA binding protein
MTNTLGRIPNLLKIKHVAEQLNVSSKTVRRWIAAGEFRTHRIGRQIRIADEDLLAFIGTRRR